MGTTKRLKLPEEFKIDKYWSGPRFEDGDEILGEYCNSCSKKPKCSTNQTLRSAMGDNFPFWSEDFVAVEVPVHYEYFKDEVTKVMCTRYKTHQKTLKGIKPEFSEGVERLIQVTREDEAKYLEDVA